MHIGTPVAKWTAKYHGCFTLYLPETSHKISHVLCAVTMVSNDGGVGGRTQTSVVQHAPKIRYVVSLRTPFDLSEGKSSCATEVRDGTSNADDRQIKLLLLTMMMTVMMTQQKTSLLLAFSLSAAL